MLPSGQKKSALFLHILALFSRPGGKEGGAKSGDHFSPPLRERSNTFVPCFHQASVRDSPYSRKVSQAPSFPVNILFSSVDIFVQIWRFSPSRMRPSDNRPLLLDPLQSLRRRRRATINQRPRRRVERGDRRRRRRNGRRAEKEAAEEDRL